MDFFRFWGGFLLYLFHIYFTNRSVVSAVPPLTSNVNVKYQHMRPVFS